MFKRQGKSNSRAADYGTLRLKLERWYASYVGKQFLAQAQSRIDGILPLLFGYHLLQIGRIGTGNLLKHSKISHRVLLDAFLPHRNDGQESMVCSDLDELPIASDSVDVVVLPHVLELHQSPHAILREIDRILVAEGHLVILGFNPWSLWGLVRWTQKWRRVTPWSGQLLSHNRLKDWMALLGFDLVDHEVFFFRPPISYPRLMERLQVMERAGQRCWPVLGAGYVLVAKKRVMTFTPVRPRSRIKRSYTPVGAAGICMRKRKDGRDG